MKGGSLLMPIIFPEHVTHSQVKIRGSEIVSAGFFTMNSIGTVDEVLDDKSTSLKIGPKDGDKKILDRMLLGMGTSSFLE